MPFVIFRLPRSFRTYRASFTSLPSSLLDRVSRVVGQYLLVLPSFQDSRALRQFTLTEYVKRASELTLLQVKYYVSRLKLLDAGLLEQAHELVQFISRATSAAAQKEDDGADDAVEETIAAVPVETAADLMVRMDGYVKAQLHDAKKRASGKDESLDAMIYEERKIARKELSGRLAKTRSRCQKCRA